MTAFRHLLQITLFLFPIVVAQSTDSSITPERIILNLTERPYNSIGIAWRTHGDVMCAQVQIARSEPWTGFTASAKSVNAVSQRIPFPKHRSAVYHNALVGGLSPNTMYIYRVGGDSVWSEWNQFRTADSLSSPFSFIFFGDPQDELRDKCSRVFREAYRTAPGAKFWLFSGDITSEPEDEQIGGFYDAGGFIFRTTPSILVPGNHDNAFQMVNGEIVRNKKGKKQRTNIPPPTWRGQFVLPENGVPGYEEMSYSVDYQGVRFIMLNTNDRLAEQGVWMEKLLASNPNRWTVVSFHHPLYSMGRERDDLETRTAFLSIFDKYHVDLVLTGHDHTYGRSHPLRNNAVAASGERGTVYVVSVSGPKMYTVNSQYTDLMAKIGGNTELFQVITVDGGTLTYRAHSADGALYDAFELRK